MAKQYTAGGDLLQSKKGDVGEDLMLNTLMNRVDILLKIAIFQYVTVIIAVDADR